MRAVKIDGLVTVGRAPRMPTPTATCPTCGTPVVREWARRHGTWFVQARCRPCKRLVAQTAR